MGLARQDFKHYSKSDWIHLINKSLKSINANDIGWEIFPGLDALPFATSEDLVSRPEYRMSFGLNDWNIGVMINEFEMISLAEEDGVDAVFLNFNKENWHLSALKSSGKDLKWYLPLEKVSLESDKFILKKDVIEFLQHTYGSLIFDNLSSFSFAQIVNSVRENGIGYNLAINLHPKTENKLKVDSYIGFLKELTDWIEREKLSEYDVAWLFDHLEVMISVNHHFLFENAFMRSMQIVWCNVQRAYNLPVSKLKITALVYHNDIDISPNDYLIMNTVSVAAAAISGSETIFIRSDESNENINEIQQLAKNLQLICKNESMLNLVEDGLAGSYVLEDLTLKLTDHIWKQLQ